MRLFYKTLSTSGSATAFDMTCVKHCSDVLTKISFGRDIQFRLLTVILHSGKRLAHERR
jgi:hypothetical protein